MADDLPVVEWYGGANEVIVVPAAGEEGEVAFIFESPAQVYARADAIKTAMLGKVSEGAPIGVG
jgi:hypothetical protein